MRILYHHRTLGDGAEGIHIREMVSAFRELGHEVRVIGPVGEAHGSSASRGGFLRSLKGLLPKALFELCEIAYSAYIFAFLACIIRRFRPDLIYDRYITFNAGTVLAAKVMGVPLVLEVNAPLALERSRESDEKLIFSKAAFAIERWTCTNSFRTIVVSSPLKSYLESIGVPARKCMVLPNGVDPGRFSPSPGNNELALKIGCGPDCTVIGFTGILRQWHGLDILAKAVEKLIARGKKVFLLVVGDGPFRADLEKLLDDMGIRDYSHITGRIEHCHVPDYVNLFDIAVSPKSTFYASPMKVIEYMALGKAVVVPNSQNFLDIIDPNVCGLTFSENDARGLADTLQTLCDHPSFRDYLGDKAREKVTDELNWKQNALKVCSYV
jgi:glycosyltransferase involved in cell wall biosynthesis